MSGSMNFLPWNPAWLAPVWMRIGAVVWQGQGVEDALAKFITLAFEVDGDAGRELAIDVLEQNKRLTLGMLLEKLRKYASVPEELDGDLGQFRDDRNWVIHHSYADVVQNLDNRATLCDVISRIENTELLGYKLACLFWDVLEKLSVEYSAGGAIPSHTAEQIRDRWRRSTAKAPLEKRVCEGRKG